ncbi:DUF6221 family protein [Streptomyces sp. NPDC048376]|uniref:DUF6221 family protein n=1 Tax=Streptomyces sp. NPDC048376 TaxID=3154926 RepID=UPI00343B4480
MRKDDAMADLVQWLLAQLDEDERTARAAMNVVGPVLGAGEWRYAESLADEGGRYWSITTVAPHDTAPTVELVGSGMSGGGVHEEALAHHITEQDPARVLRETDAKRQLLDLHGLVHRDLIWLDETGEERTAEIPVCGHCVPRHSAFPRPSAVPQGPCATLRLLALPYADRHGYRPDWRP